MAADPYKYFRIEAAEIVDHLGKGLLDLEKRADAELVARLLRLAHTLKGAARIVKHRELADLAHALEDVLEPLRGAPVPQRLDAALGLIDRMTAQVVALTKPDARAPAAPVETTTTVPRIDAGQLDEVLGGLGEVYAMLGRVRAAPDPQVAAQRLEQLERELRGVRHDVERLRLLPARSVLTSLERTARDAALSASKRVELVVTGGDVRLDAQILAALHAPLIQLVRNAVAHGLEAPAARVAAGKPPEGHIAIAFHLDGSRIVVSCTDDGRGIDHEAVRRDAIKRGLSAERARELDHAQLLRLLLRGGITTSAEVSELAGRGIGLDLVGAAVRELGGEVTATTTDGTGTTITLAVPASLAAVAALIVEAGGRDIAIPQAAIRRIVRLAADGVTRAPDGLTVSYDDLSLPFVPLASLLGGRGEHGGTMVVIAAGSTLVAIGIDRTLVAEDVVVRALPARVPVDPIVWGVALDVAGRPRPVLDPAAVVTAVQRAPIESVAPVVRPLPILVVDDSLTTRMLEQSILESAGFAVEVATSGEEAIERVARQRYGLMLVDVEMPGIDGFAVVAHLRARPEHADLPAILVTSRGAPEDRQRGAAVGAQGYVVKSEFDQVELLAMIRRLVRT